MDKLKLLKTLDKMSVLLRSLLQRTSDYDKSDRSNMEIGLICDIEDTVSKLLTDELENEIKGEYHCPVDLQGGGRCG